MIFLLSRSIVRPIAVWSRLGGLEYPDHAVTRIGRVDESVDADCQVVAWSGDNPNSLAGLRLQRPGDASILAHLGQVVAEQPHVGPRGVEPHQRVAPRGDGALADQRQARDGGVALGRARAAEPLELPVL